MKKALLRLAIGALLAFCTVALGTGGARAEQAAPPSRQILVLTRLAPTHFQLNSAYGGSYGSSQTRRAQRRLAEDIARKNGLILADAWPLPLIGLDCFVMAVPEGRTIDDAVRQVSQNRAVVFAEPMQVYTAKEKRASYNDPLYPAQPSAQLWHLVDLHRISTGRGVRVAVIDSGVETSHPDLAGQVAASVNFVAGRPQAAERHGTAVAGVIAAKADNRLGIVGVAPASRVLGLRACWQQGGTGETVCDTLSLAKALHFAVEHRAQVVNFSLAGPRAELLDRLVGVALRLRIDVIAAVDPALPGGGFPASHRGVIAVADEALARPVSGVYVAPGEGIVTALPGGRWNLVDGSSYAAAHVSGLFALVRARKSAADARSLLVAAGRGGGGTIDACATLLRAAGPCNCPCPLTAEAAVRR